MLTCWGGALLIVRMSTRYSDTDLLFLSVSISVVHLGHNVPSVK